MRSGYNTRLSEPQLAAQVSDLVSGHSLYKISVRRAGRRGFFPGTPVSSYSLSPHNRRKVEALGY